MKILACCSGGIDRSVGLKSALFVEGKTIDAGGDLDVIPIGLNRNTDETKAMLFEWADIICVCGERSLYDLIPSIYRNKARHYDVGPDTYGSPNHWALINRFQQLLEVQPI